MTKPKRSHAYGLLIRIVVSVILVVGGVYVLVRQWDTVEHSLRLAQDAQIGWLIVASALMVTTFVVAAAIYGTLALHSLRYRQTFLIEVATALVNKLLPAGIGGLGLHGLYLHRRGHSPAEATVVVSVNNLVGMVAHLLLLALVLLGNPGLLHTFIDGRHGVDVRLLGVVAGAVCLVLVLPPIRRRIGSFGRHLLLSLRKLRLAQLGTALSLAMILTAAYTCMLYASASSVGVELSLLQIFIVFSIGMLAATATPTPGGLVGAEAGLFTGFVAYGVPSVTAGAAVLLYRLVSYWIPLLPGALALLFARRSKLV